MTAGGIADVRGPATAGGIRFVEDWREWRQHRFAVVTAPHGQAALTLTYWLGDEPRSIPGLSGSWRSHEGRLVGSELEPGDYELPNGTPLQGEAEISAEGIVEIRAGERAIRRFERDGVLALRIFDPAAEGRVGLLSAGPRGVEAYDPDEAWRIDARFEPDPQEREIELVDGYRKTAVTSGSLVFALDGVERRLAGTVRPDGIGIVFGDTTNGEESYGFRFLTAQLPDEDGSTVIDFNRAFLPPCAFSDQFVCPLPTQGNRLPVPIRAGERVVRHGGAAYRGHGS